MSSYTIGIGVLIDGEQFNLIRQTELQLAIKTNNWSGLGQPPHITIKRPFSVSSQSEIKSVAQIMQSTAKNYSPFNITLEGVDSFGSNALYAKVQPSKHLESLHASFLETLKPYYQAIDKFEGPNMIYHSTLAMDTSEAEFSTASSLLKQKPLVKLDCSITKLGLFLGIDDLQHWVIIAESSLSKP